jgi:hypothetical protein
MISQRSRADHSSIGKRSLIAGSVSVRPRLPAEEVDYLSMTLSRAFAKAQPQDWVIFCLSQPSPASVTEMTTGAWYVEGTTLHLLLANYRTAVSMNNIRDVLERDLLFEVLSAPRYEFAETDYVYAGSKKKSLLSSLRQETPHLAIDYTRLFAEELDHNGPRDEKGENPTQ